jgi:hypothetical protein
LRKAAATSVPVVFHPRVIGAMFNQQMWMYISTFVSSGVVDGVVSDIALASVVVWQGCDGSRDMHILTYSVHILMLSERSTIAHTHHYIQWYSGWLSETPGTKPQ